MSPDSTADPHRTPLPSAAVATWLVLVAIGSAPMSGYESAPAVGATPPAQWPADSALSRDDALNLILLPHPRCPGTRATLRELEHALIELLRNDRPSCAETPVYGCPLLNRPILAACCLYPTEETTCVP